MSRSQSSAMIFNNSSKDAEGKTIQSPVTTLPATAGYLPKLINGAPCARRIHWKFAGLPQLANSWYVSVEQNKKNHA